VRRVAPFALQHRLPAGARANESAWGEDQKNHLEKIFPDG
jgi:hypothetical protein